VNQKLSEQNISACSENVERPNKVEGLRHNIELDLGLMVTFLKRCELCFNQLMFEQLATLFQ
jgi:hypothetical protein